MMDMHACPGFTRDSDCPFSHEMCWRCNRTNKGLRKATVLDSLFAYDAKEKHCPNLLSQVHWNVIKNLRKTTK